MNKTKLAITVAIMAVAGVLATSAHRNRTVGSLAAVHTTKSTLLAGGSSLGNARFGECVGQERSVSAADLKQIAARF